MISHRLADDYIMADLFSFNYDLLQSFCFVCKSFLLASFMNENEVFPFKIYIYIYIYIDVINDII
jgi:hypothetical protein